jgi:hypothetical protein
LFEFEQWEKFVEAAGCGRILGFSEKLESKDEDKNDAEQEERLEINHYRDSMIGTESWSV